MKKYKLVKNYPGSPELGSIHEGHVYEEDYYITYNNHRVIALKEFWQEVKELPEYVKCIQSYVNGCKASIKDTVYDTKIKPDFSTLSWAMIYDTGRFIPATKEEYDAQFVKKDYEIISFSKPNGSFPNNIYLVRANGRLLVDWPEYKKMNADGNATHWTEAVEKGFIIHSVKRLSDSEIFTVGDKVVLPNKTKEVVCITEIKFYNKKINLYYASNTSISNIDNGTGNWFEMIKHYKQPLFTTEDGVEIFKGDRVFIVTDNFNIGYSGELSYHGPTLSKAFSTQKAAENYIKCNKPCLSYNDVWNLKTIKSPDNNYVIIHKKELEKLVKTKLK